MDLKSFREDKLKIKTQTAFAELIGVEQSNISRWEKDPDSIPYQIIQRILEKTGASYEELTGWKKPVPDPLIVEDTWKKTDFTKCTLSEYIANTLKQINLPDELRKTYIDDLSTGINTNLVKPKVAIVGRSDTGKSTLINALLGSEKMPTAWTPTTSIAVYIKHISDRPTFIEEDAWVFANHLGNEDMWNERQLYDEEYCRSWKIAAGGVEILRSFGTRQGENYNRKAGTAVIFLDAPILKTCDIVDLPGFGTETESDDDITFAATQKSDVIIYLSQANGFMRIEDITYLKRNISELPVWEDKNSNTLSPLSNLFIVASQAHTVNSGNRIQLTEILDVGCKNLLKTLPDGYWAERERASNYEYTNEGYAELRARFFAYTTDILDVCKPFNEKLTEILEALPAIINERTKIFVRSYVVSRKLNLTGELQKYEGIVVERDRYEALLKEIENNELSRVRDNDVRKKSVCTEISCLCKESFDEFSSYISSTINIDALVNLMREKGVKNKKEEVELFGISLQSILQAKCESILKAKSEILAEKTKDYITAFSESIEKPFEDNSINVDFNAGWAFASALSKIGMIGGLGAIISRTISGIALLSSIGVSLSAGTTVSVAMIGNTPILGPIGLVCGLALAGGLGVVKLFGGGWEKSVAKKIVAAIEENEVAEKYRASINEYWDQTESAFEQAATNLDKEWSTYVENLRETINSHDINEIQSKIATLKFLSDFFDNIPL
ncbi:dynamin family protein [Anaerotignum faecicola]